MGNVRSFAGSITIITPYKGQKTAIIHALRKQKLLPKPEFHQKQDPRSKQTRLPDLGSQVMVSTVDRYQGDENDVVILSLVRQSESESRSQTLNTQTLNLEP